MTDKIEPKNVTCYIPIEVKARELDSKLYLAFRLAKEGFSVIIGSKIGVHKNIFVQKKRFIYFDKGISKSLWNFYRAIKASNGLIVEIHEEGQIGSDPSNIITDHNNHCAELFSLIFTWGQKQKDIILKNCIRLKKNVIINTGHPSFDLLNKNHLTYYHKLSKLHYGVKSNYVLINTNFSDCNGYLSYDEFVKFNAGIGGNKEFYNDQKRKEWKKRSELQEKVLIEFLKMIKILSISFPKKKFVVRPHPVEKMDIYKKEFCNLDNVNVIREGSAREWIVDAESVIHYDCTTGIEAFLAGKNVISFCPFYDEESAAQVPIKISIKIKNINKLVEFIKNNYKDDNLTSFEIKKENIKILENIFANVEKEATSQIVTSIKKICEEWTGKETKILKKYYYLFIFKFQNLIKRLVIRYFMKANKTKKFDDLVNYKISYLNKNELSERLNIWYEHFSTPSRLKIKEIMSDTFLIEN